MSFMEDLPLAPFFGYHGCGVIVHYTDALSQRGKRAMIFELISAIELRCNMCGIHLVWKHVPRKV